jgi:hypothetical protein
MPGIRLRLSTQNILQIQIPTDWGADRCPFIDPLFATLHFARRVTDMIHLHRIARDFHQNREQETSCEFKSPPKMQTWQQAAIQWL